MFILRVSKTCPHFVSLLQHYRCTEPESLKMLDPAKIIIPLILLLPLTAGTNYSHDGKNIIMQSDVETVVIHQKLKDVEFHLLILLEQANQIGQITLEEHVRNCLGKGEGMVNILVSASILASVKHIEIIMEYFSSFFDQHAEPASNKRALEILGSFLSTMPGVPSAFDHRYILEQIRLLKLDSEEMGDMLKRQNGVNQDKLSTFHFQEYLIGNMSEKITRINRKLSANAKQIELISAVISMTIKINMALERTRFTIAHMKEIKNDDKHGHLSVFIIPFPRLSSLVDRIYFKRRENSPIFAGKDCRFYYNQPLPHSYNKEVRQITTPLQIPIAPMQQSFKLVVLNKANQLHPDLPLAIIKVDMNYYRLMTLSDYDQCLTAKNSIICNKKEIMILAKVGCSLKQNNCADWAADTVNDIKNSKILNSLLNETNTTLSCDNADTQIIVLPRKAMITLGIHCQLQTLTFLISKLSYRHHRELDYRPSHRPRS